MLRENLIKAGVHLFGHLSTITQAISLAENQQQVLDLIVAKVCSTLEVEVCSIHLADYELKQFVLMANKGLNSDSVGQLHIDFGKGLVGLVGQRERPIHLSSASLHPAFHYVEDILEDAYSAYLGVPIIHQRKVLGVLSIQQKVARQFEIDEETFLITLAAQISAVISNRETDAIIDDEGRSSLVRCIMGNPVSNGVVVGVAKVFFPSQDISRVPLRKTDSSEKEIKRLRKAVKRTHLQLERMSRRMKGLISEQERSLFQTYQQILGTAGIESEVEEQINAGYWAPSALRIVILKHVRIFQSMEDPYLRERAHDIEDLANRVLTNMIGEESKTLELEEGTILVAETVSASMLAELPLKNLLAVVSLKGSTTSHAAILTKALGIPAIMGLDPCQINRLDGKKMIVDAYNGRIFISPNSALIKQYELIIREERRFSKDLEKEQSHPNSAKCGTAISLLMNSSSGLDFGKAKESGAQGIGLYRTEIPFMQHPHFPSEEEQTKIYRDILISADGMPVTIRTLDIGGDKQLPYFEIKEENPFLGWRGVRVTLDHPEIFLVQLRALFRANIDLENLKIALPMVATLEELDECNRLINQAFYEIQEEHSENDIQLKKPNVGIILEVPSAVFQLSSFIKRVDFISIGTNDLIQYLMAVDRNNLKLRKLYSHFQPALLNMLKQIMQIVEQNPIPIQVCGEMASDPMAIILLIGLGFREFSMNSSSFFKVKRAISRFTVKDMKEIAAHLMTFETEAKVKSEMLQIMDKRGLGGLLRAGI